MSTEDDIRKASDKFYAGLNIPLMAIGHRWRMCGHAIRRYRNAPY